MHGGSASTDFSAPGERIASYVFPDDALAAGSTLGAPAICMVVKATGAVEKIYAIDAGEVLFGSLLLHHWDERTGVKLERVPGEFVIRPELQEHRFALVNGIAVRETLFVLNGGADGGEPEPPAAYCVVELRNESASEVRLASYAFCRLRGTLPHDVVARYRADRRAFAAWNACDEGRVRLFWTSETPASVEVTPDHGKAISQRCPGTLSNETTDSWGDPLGVFHHRHRLSPGESVRVAYGWTFAPNGMRGALRTLAACPSADDALARTRQYYADVLGRSVVVTPDPEVNRGVFWAKANMLRTELQAPTGPCFVNDPTRSNNSVARDTAWFAYGADYLTPDFARDSLLAYVERQEPSGMIVEYYDVRTGHTEDYGLNVNDDTPLLVLALWHHYTTSGDEDFLRRIYPAAARAGRFLLSQRNDLGLVWCTSHGTQDWGIVGWRNVIQNYRLSGATTEVNAESCAALATIAHMARVLGKHEESGEFAAHAHALREAINTHLLDPATGLYYLTIDVDGHPRRDVTSDLVFPVMFGVADDETAARIIARLSMEDFWTPAGIRTVPRDAPEYGPDHGAGLLGGVWVAVTFWFAFAAAKFNASFMAYALSTSFRHYSSDPKKNNTVPGQFSEWLHGETLANRGMMLSPWFPPRYLWAAIEGAAGLDLSGPTPSLAPRMPPDWKWLGVHNLPFRGTSLTWFAARTPELKTYANFAFHQSAPYIAYRDDISANVETDGQASASLGLRQDGDLALLIGNTVDRTVATAVRVKGELQGTFRMREFNSMRGAWIDGGTVAAERLSIGIPLELERKGFVLLELQQET